MADAPKRSPLDGGDLPPDPKKGEGVGGFRADDCPALEPEPKAASAKKADAP